jgi:hypothetical protein
MEVFPRRCGRIGAAPTGIGTPSSGIGAPTMAGVTRAATAAGDRQQHFLGERRWPRFFQERAASLPPGSSCASSSSSSAEPLQDLRPRRQVSNHAIQQQVINAAGKLPRLASASAAAVAGGGGLAHSCSSASAAGASTAGLLAAGGGGRLATSSSNPRSGRGDGRSGSQSPPLVFTPMGGATALGAATPPLPALLRSEMR